MRRLQAGAVPLRHDSPLKFESNTKICVNILKIEYTYLELHINLLQKLNNSQM